MRRIFDLICSAAGLIFLAPLFAVIALAIKLDDGGPIFYSQPRVGKGLRLFSFYKFRSMVPGADRRGLLTTAADTRVTRVGRFLRRLKLDELPQLINVLTGDMQLVGPRPELQHYTERFHSEYEQLLQDRPGITDAATLAYREEEKMFVATGIEEQYVSQILPDKLRISLDYQQRRTFFSDLHILLLTVFNLQSGYLAGSVSKDASHLDPRS